MILSSSSSFAILGEPAQRQSSTWSASSGLSPTSARRAPFYQRARAGQCSSNRCSQCGSWEWPSAASQCGRPTCTAAPAEPSWRGRRQPRPCVRVADDGVDHYPMVGQTARWSSASKPPSRRSGDRRCRHRPAPPDRADRPGGCRGRRRRQELVNSEPGRSDLSARRLASRTASGTVVGGRPTPAHRPGRGHFHLAHELRLVPPPIGPPARRTGLRPPTWPQDPGPAPRS